MKYRFEIDICFDLDKNHHEEYKAWKDAEDEIDLMKNEYENKLYDEKEKEEIESIIKEKFRGWVDTLELDENDVEYYKHDDGVTKSNEEYHLYEGYSYDGENVVSYSIYSYEE